MKMTLLFLSLLSLSGFTTVWVSNASIKNNANFELLSFTGEVAEMQAKLAWETKHEVDASYFELERSLDNKTFSTIAKVNIVDQTGEGQHYYYIDKSPLDGYNYYRLKLIKLDGQFSYSKTLGLQFIPLRELSMHPVRY